MCNIQFQRLAIAHTSSALTVRRRRRQFELFCHGTKRISAVAGFFVRLHRPAFIIQTPHFRFAFKNGPCKYFVHSILPTSKIYTHADLRLAFIGRNGKTEAHTHFDSAFDLFRWARINSRNLCDRARKMDVGERNSIAH